MTLETFVEAIEEASDLGECYGDLRDLDIIEHVSLIMNLEFDQNSVLGRAVIDAYDYGKKKALSLWLPFCEFSVS